MDGIDSTLNAHIKNSRGRYGKLEEIQASIGELYELSLKMKDGLGDVKLTDIVSLLAAI